MKTRRLLSHAEIQRISTNVRNRWNQQRSGYDPQERHWYPSNRLWNRPSASGEIVTESSALKVAVVYACIQCISQDIAKIPMFLVSESEGRRQKVFNPLSKLFLSRPNPEMDAFQFKQTLQAHKLGWGNAYAEIEYNKKGEPIGLWLITPDRVTVRRNQAGSIEYEIRLDAGKKVTLPAQKVFHLPGWGFDGLVGYSPIRIAADNIGLAMAQQTFGGSFYGNGAYPGIMLKHPARLTKPAQDRLKESWEEVVKGASLAHRTVILEEGMTAEKMTINPQDAQYLEGQQFSVENICRIFRVPPHKVQHLLRSTFSNIESQNTEYVVDCLQPHAACWEYEAKTCFDLPDELNFRFDFKELLRGDAVARSTYYMNMRNCAGITSNEIREAEGYDPVPGGDVLLVQGAMTTLDRVIKGENFGTKPAPQDTPPKKENKNAATMDKIAEFHEQMLGDFFARSLVIETERVSKAAKKPDFQVVVNEFYKKHADTLRCGIRNVVLSFCETGVQLGFASVNGIEKVNEICNRHITESVLNLSPSTVDAAVIGWNETRARNFARVVMNELIKEMNHERPGNATN